MASEVSLKIFLGDSPCMVHKKLRISFNLPFGGPWPLAPLDPPMGSRGQSPLWGVTQANTFYKYESNILLEYLMLFRCYKIFVYTNLY